MLILVVDDEPDVELLFRQRFRHDVRAGRFAMERIKTPADIYPVFRELFKRRA